MGGGRERSVIVWDIHWALLFERYDAVRSELERLAEAEEPPTGKRHERLLELEADRQRLLLALSRLGPTPSAKMG
jgi:hypothetical protein